MPGLAHLQEIVNRKESPVVSSDAVQGKNESEMIQSSGLDISPR